MGPGPRMWVLVGASSWQCDHTPATGELWGAQSRATRGHAQLARAKVNIFFPWKQNNAAAYVEALSLLGMVLTCACTQQ